MTKYSYPNVVICRSVVLGNKAPIIGWSHKGTRFTDAVSDKTGHCLYDSATIPAAVASSGWYTINSQSYYYKRKRSDCRRTQDIHFPLREQPIHYGVHFHVHPVQPHSGTRSARVHSPYVLCINVIYRIFWFSLFVRPSAYTCIAFVAGEQSDVCVGVHTATWTESCYHDII